MNVRWLVLPVAFAAWCQIVQAAPEHAAAAGGDAGGQPVPAIRFLRPIKGEHFSDLPIYVQVGVDGFQLVPPSKSQSKALPANAGYVRYSMDDYPVCGTDETQVMIGKFLGAHYIPVGWHTLKAELVDANGSALNPPVFAETQAFSGHTAAVEVDHVQGGSVQAESNAQELYKARLQLQQLKGELQRIRAGSSGFVPVPLGDGEHRGE